MQDEAQNSNGGIINANLGSSSITLEISSCSFVGCNASNSGGALYLFINNTGESTLRNLSFNQCEAQTSGGAIYSTLESGGKMIITGSCLFTDCKTLSNNSYGGGGIYALVNDENSQLTIEDSITFERCSGFIGGGMYLEVNDLGKLIMTGFSSFYDCNGAYGGGCQIDPSKSNYDINLLGKMQFERCTSDKYGGGLNIYIEYVGQITINEMSFDNCNTTQSGGGFYSDIRSGAQMIITGKITFNNCCCDAQGSGGGQYLSAYGPSSIVNITGELEYNKCEANYGGGFNAAIQNEATVEINKATFIDCSCDTFGGGMFLRTSSGGNFTITRKWTFTNGNSSHNGGGLYLEAENGTVNFNQNQQILIENCCCDGYGGGIYCSISYNGQISLNNIKLNKCNSQKDGGGICAEIESGGQLTLDKSCEIYQCESHGNGGGIDINIDYESQCSFIINDAYIHECQALNSTDSSFRYSYSGFGGGIFIGGDGDYSPSSKLINLHGMKIYNNTANKYGQSLYIAMPQVIELCQQGILGEYVKGNYSDKYSDENDLVGIPVDSTTFIDSTFQTIEQQSQHLELWWRILGILKKAQVIVNVSNPTGKLLFHIEGKRMISGYLNVKIFELKNKLIEEIDQEQKEIKHKFNKNNLKSLKRKLQSPISQKHQNVNQQQIFISTNLKIKLKLLPNQTNEIIYPPEDGSSSPIQIDGELESKQNATFGMNEYKWLNYKLKEYGVLISNDRKIFTGKYGIDIEEDENAAIKLEVLIEEEEKRKGLTIGIIASIAVVALAIVAVIVIIVIVAVFISRKTRFWSE
ncbi:MAG: hypothetical protein EZS28_029364 [Streblomastix strix]|uniref:Right handed beta helix domain-containing protein n=1 Tax=Streblomastix strix TaxID=222440 RepID=A0A5J4UXA5_9EUKA|nr:MAG: hypothetical protein EZS28_029364 [Streblomastix strix]